MMSCLKAKIIGEGNAAQTTRDEFAEWYFLKGNEHEIKHKELCEFEVQRQKNIARNQEILRGLGLA